MQDQIPLFEISWDHEEVRNVVDSVGRGMYWSKGPYVDQFEDQLKDYLGVDHALVVNSGTTALVSALKANNIGSGDEVIVPSFTFIATANAVKLAGAEPVFADIENETYGLDPAAVRKEITEDTVAIMPVHVYGSVCMIEELHEISKENDLLLIEDAAAALGAELQGKKVGTFGDTAIFSFAQNKIVATGEGGAIVTNKDEIAKRVKLYRSHGRVSENYFESASTGKYVDLGSNFRMADVVASIGSAQMERINYLIDGRREAANYMTKELSKIDGVRPHVGREGGRHVYQLYTVILDPSIDRDYIIADLENKGVSSKVYWNPIHLTDYYREKEGFHFGAYPVTEQVGSQVLSLPIHPDITQKEMDYIIETLRNSIQRRSD